MNNDIKIFCFINSLDRMGGIVMAVSENGYCLCSHLSSNEYWAKRDIGINSYRKHNIYNHFYPKGWQLEWVDNPKDHSGLRKAYKLNQALPKK